MANKTSDHVKPCNIGQSEAHNRRSEVYLAHINANRIYIRRELTNENESWISEQMQGRDLQQYYEALGKMVKEKTGRAMQTKERKVINKKTGRVKTISGSSPIRESVVVCKSDTTMEQLRQYCERCHERFGISAIQIHIHRDEGHYEEPDKKTSWMPNYHAHIIWDWMNHENGKSCKLNADDMSLLQDMVSDALNMDRGKSKAETGKEHLERNDFILAKQKKEIEKGKQETEQVKLRTEALSLENEEKKKISADLDKQISEKAARVNTENGNALLSGLANIAGKGKYAKIEKENKELKESIPKMRERLQQSFQDTVKKEVAKQTTPLKEENKRLVEERDSSRQLAEQRRLNYNELVKRFNTMQQNLSDKLEEADTLVKSYQSRLKSFLLMLSEVTRKAVVSIIEFASNVKAKCFSFNQASAVDEYMKCGNDRKYDGEALMIFSRPFLSDEEFNKGKVEVDNVALNFEKYEQAERERIEQENQPHRRRGR